MQSPSGLLGPLIGPLGPMYVRKKKNGDLIIVPRARTDAKTPSQLEYRRRLTYLSKIASKIYLFVLKPFKTFFNFDSTIVADFCKLNMSAAAWIPEYYFLRLLPRNFPVDELCSFRRDSGTGVVNAIIPYDYAEHVLPGDVIYVVVFWGTGPRLFMGKFTATAGVQWIPCPGIDFTSRTLIFYSALLVRSAGGGLVSVLYQSIGSVMISAA